MSHWCVWVAAYFAIGTFFVALFGAAYGDEAPELGEQGAQIALALFFWPLFLALMLLLQVYKAGRSYRQRRLTPKP